MPRKRKIRARRLHIIMACNRPKNLGTLIDGYITNMEPHPWELRWHLLFQGPEPDEKGLNKTNEGIKLIKDGWMFLLSDDTVQHPSLFRRLHEAVEANPDAGAVVFDQDRGFFEDRGHNWHLIPNPERMWPGEVCGGQVAWNRKFVGKVRYDIKRGGWADGYMVMELYNQAPNRFVFVRELLMTFGSMEWKTANPL